MAWTMLAAQDPQTTEKAFDLKNLPSVIDERLSLEAFSQLAGSLGGHPFVKVVVDREKKQIHFLNHTAFPFHSDYIGTHIIGVEPAKIDAEIDRYNQIFYHDPKRRFFLCVLALHKREDRRFFSLETVEVDSMSLEMMREMYASVREMTDPSLAIFVKPANHVQESYLTEIDPQLLPRILAHELFATSRYIPLNAGQTEGRIRAFIDESAYQRERASIQWYDIIVMPKVPEDIPRMSGIINAEHTTPLSHTNVLAAGWQIPNCIQIGIIDRIMREDLNNQWVRYTVSSDLTEVKLERTGARDVLTATPPWQHTRVTIESPETQNIPIVSLDQLRMSDRNRYGTKAANLGELYHVLAKGSERLTGFYKIPRPPRASLLPYLASTLGAPENANLSREAGQFIRKFVKLPRGVAIPFSMQSRFLESSPRIQQAIGKLKMALELNARQVEPLCVELQNLILATKIPEAIREEIDLKIAENLAGVSNFVVRSSSNAEDLQNFSAAGIYESVNHVSTADKILESVKKVWASILSPRSVRLRQEVGISLDDVYMGVIVQEEVPSTMGGVLVTTNPANRADFRNVYVNASKKSVVHVVSGTDLPYQFLFNTVERAGRTISMGSATQDLSEKEKNTLQNLAICGRLLQSHFSASYTFADPVDIEWLANGDEIYILQLRPYAR